MKKKFEVVCLNCGKFFTSTSLSCSCPYCGNPDVEDFYGTLEVDNTEDEYNSILSAFISYQGY